MSAGELSGKTVIVTGGSMGIGLACAEEVLRRGARVMLCARAREPLDAAVARLDPTSAGNVRACVADVANASDVARLFDTAEASFAPVDAVIHSAGVYGPIGPVVQVDPDEWFDAIRLNLLGSFLVAREACRRMIDGGTAGSIVLMSGGGAATPFPNYTAYACGKVGVVRLTETLALEVAPHGIRVNCIAPGFVATRLHDQTLAAGAERAGAFLETTRSQLEKGGVAPTVAARTASFLVSDAAKGISGRFVAAPYDAWEQWPERLEQITGSDLFTLRRIVPRDRGQDWQ